MANQYKNKVVYNGTTLIDISDTTAVQSDVASGKSFYTASGQKVLGTASGSSGTGQTVTGTIAGDGTSVLEIPCDFEPDLIYVYGDMSDDAANRGITSLTLIKDASIYIGADTSASSTGEYVASYHGITGYNESDASNIHATYSNGTLTINTMSNSSSGKWRSGQVYNYELSTIGTGGGSSPAQTQHTILFEFEDTTTESITAYWDGTFISDAIKATMPTSYGGKTVQEASIDGYTWYIKPSEDWDVLFDGSITFSQQSPYNSIWFGALGDLQPAVGEVYRVTVDGTVYNLTAHEDDGRVYIGNPMYDWGTDDDSGTPFCLFNGGYNSLQGWTELSATSHTLKLEKQVLS